MKNSRQTFRDNTEWYKEQWSLHVYSALHSCLKTPTVDYLQSITICMPQLRLVFTVNGLSQLDETKIGHVQQKKISPVTNCI